MGVWAKSPKQDPAVIGRLQASVDSNAQLQARIRELQESARERSIASGRSGWGGHAEQIKKLYQQAGIQIPDGYDVDSEGQIVYTNKTPYLQQAAFAAAPIAIPSAIQALLPAGVAGTAGGSGGAAASATGAGGLLPATHPATSMLWGAPSAGISQGVSAGIAGAAGAAGGDFLGEAARRGAERGSQGLLDKGMNSLQQAALAALAGLPGLLANKGPSNEEKAALDQARQLQALQQKRIEHQGPLYEAVTRLAMSRMPAGVQMPIQPLDRG